MIKVSVIIPVYNIPNNMLEDCANSLLAQTLKDIEFIFVDDCSVNSANSEYLARLSKEDKRVIYIRHEINKGVSEARNTGIDFAKGEYLGFVDADDVVAASMYQDMLNEADINNADIVVCSTNYEQRDGTLIPSIRGNYLVDVNNKGRMPLFFNTGLGTCDKLISRSIIGNLRFCTQSSHNEDYHFNWELMAKAQRVKYINNIYYTAKWRVDSASRVNMSERKFCSTFVSLGNLIGVADRIWGKGDCKLAKYLYYKVMTIGPANIMLFKMNDITDLTKNTYNNFMSVVFKFGRSKLSRTDRFLLYIYNPIKSKGKSGVVHKMLRFKMLYGLNRMSGQKRFKSFKNIISSHI